MEGYVLHLDEVSPCASIFHCITLKEEGEEGGGTGAWVKTGDGERGAAGDRGEAGESLRGGADR